MKESAYDRMFQFLEGIRDSNDRAPIAHLKRSLAFPPGQYVPAYPYVHRFTSGNFGHWSTQVAYLVAGLWAQSRASKEGTGNFGDSVRQLQAATDSSSIELRFLALLEADTDQLVHHLRQMTALMSGADIAPDWCRLCNDLRWWNGPERRVQQRWASAYYSEPRQDKPDSNDENGTSNSGKES